MLSKKRRNGKLCLSLAVALIFGAASSVSGFDKPDAGKTAGSLEERKIFERSQSDVNIEIEQQGKSVSPSTQGPRVKVAGVHITGQTIFSEDRLRAVVQDTLGRELTLSQLEDLAARIAEYLHEQGYIVAYAYIPAQDIKDGVVEIAVEIGQYGDLDIRNHSQLADSAVDRLLSSIKSGDYIKSDSLERALLLLNDTSGVNVQATLAPGKTSGTADLIVEINDTAKTTGQISIDNYGIRFTGQIRGSISLTANNPSGLGDAVNIREITAGRGLNDTTWNYLLPVGGQGLRLGLGYAQLHYALREDFADLNASGESKTTGIYVTYPLVRSRNYNLYSRIGYEHKKLEDRIDALASITDKRAQVWAFGLSGDSRDKWGGGGINSFALTFAAGSLTIDSSEAQAIDSITAQTAGSYSKANISFSRMQYLNSRLTFYLGLTGQFADKNLDSSEKLCLGGVNGVRAYPQSEASGDQGYLVNGELRWNLPTPAFQLAAFIDSGQITINKKPWPDAGVNSRHLTGAGLGLIFSKAEDYSIRLDYAWKLTSDPATADTDKSGRFWLQGVKNI
ncbi:MAG TPA: ShlB/FhaC/HecB family hemolysin secretion/activation protein [Methylomusa anaerophila]|uniref:Heme/hemopexin transporter protein HuxB n=1 Tax=Methylomusa anaerophila TaxID=1930071 RepID=A0A348AGA8_9FIRM|nr:ShlB/FhaC/HecB family hemolysin secretion/activation protein [Methylomusa anaerophila]BBB90106.1 heme/hemopexin transporter protein HuxB precursor [Methylomusa anaerophila]HML88169.1 ShlB/FhaC/HecB family hemolysin secretion/activation protein [Methylomusa anaerophila]